MNALTQPVPENTIPPLVTPGQEPGNGMSSLLSVLCVSEDPLFLDRIRRNLEQSRDIIVEISVSVEDALHLIDYIFFDAIVTDCTSWLGEQNGFLKALRKQGKEVPIIYFIREPDVRITQEARQYGRVQYLAWEERCSSPPFDELARCVREVAALDAVTKSGSGTGWPRLIWEKMV